MEMYDDPEHVKGTFIEQNLSPYVLQAQWAEFVELKKVIHDLYQSKKSPLKVLDIGVGEGRVPRHLCGIQEVWEAIEHYDGIDVSQNCVEMSQKTIKDLNIENKVSAKLLDGMNLKSLSKKYDLIIATWFTAGNFYPSDFDFKNFTHGYDLSKNEKFTTVFRQAYDLLNKGGEIMIGAIYIENEATRQKQEAWYRNIGFKIITDERDSYTATREGWWSQRFTRQKLYDYLSFVPPEKIIFIPLDTYDFSMIVRIKK